LTGTPIENRLAELWSIFDFLMPGFLQSYAHFKEHFEIPIVRDGDEKKLSRLSKIVGPFLMRRLKAQVLTELPPKTEQILTAEMGDKQRKLYAAYALKAKERIEAEQKAGTFEKRKLSVLTLLMRLRQICCDPALCAEGVKGDSCKREACMELIKTATAGGHRILLFSQFTAMLEILQKELEKEDISFMTLTGKTPAAQRLEMVDEFNNGDCQVFLISLKAGGTGLNLTGADVVIHYDPWWNVAAQNQATDRAYRIGQQNPVQVVRLVTADTVEQRILQLQQAKEHLSDAVLGGSVNSLSSLTAEELLSII
jgi:SNF2 family DNA or RNA helicase